MSDLLVRDVPGPLVVEGDERAARAELRRQIGRLELQLSRLAAGAFPLLKVDTSVAAAASTPRRLGLGELEVVRDALAARISAARIEIAERDELETENRDVLERMLERPRDFKWMRISRADVGEPGCGGWHALPRLGMLGMLMGWWRVKVSSGCPL
jgi:hypothetical protein